MALMVRDLGEMGVVRRMQMQVYLQGSEGT